MTGIKLNPLLFVIAGLACFSCAGSKSKGSAERSEVSIQEDDFEPTPEIANGEEEKKEQKKEQKKEEGKALSHLANVVVLDDVTAIKPSPQHNISSIDDLPQFCSDSGGVWHKNLHSCYCPKNMLFSHFYGCTPIAISTTGLQCLGRGLQATLLEDGEEAFDHCISKLFPKGSQLSFAAIKKYTFDHRQAIAETLDKNGFEFLKGENDFKQSIYSMPNGNVDFLTLEITPMRTLASQAMDFDLESRDLSHAALFARSIGIDNTNELAEATQCRDRLIEYFPDASEDIERACLYLEKQLRSIVQEDLTSGEYTIDPIQCLGACGISYALPFQGDTFGYYYVYMRSFYPLLRSIDIRDPDHFDLNVQIDSQGKIEKFEFVGYSWSTVPNESKYCGVKNILTLDGNGRQYEQKRVELLGNLDEIERIVSHYAKDRLQTKSEKAAVSNLLFIDEGLDLSNPTVARSLHLDDSKLDMFMHTNDPDIKKTILQSPSFYSAHPGTMIRPNYVWNLFTNESEIVKHSNIMLNTALKNVDDVELFFLTPDEFINAIETKWEEIARFINDNNIDVVLPPHGMYERIGPNLIKMIERCADTVFVFPAGNFNLINPISDYAWSAIQSGLPNVVVPTVMEMDGSFRLNRGRNIATIAVQGRGINSTSSASAAVANYLLQENAKITLKSGKDKVTRLLQRLSPIKGLPVREEGVLNLNL